jgi:hypothetical protein
MAQLLEAVLQAFPEWRPLVRVETAEDGSPIEVLEVQAPRQAQVERGLGVDTSGGELTITFDFYHAHFPEGVGDGTHFGAAAGVEFIRKLVAEQVAVMSWWEGERCFGFSHLEAGEKPELPSWAAGAAVDRLRVRSWRGTLNADVEV